MLLLLWVLQLSSPTNIASIVMHQAMAKALGRFNKTIARQQQQQEEQEPESAAAKSSQRKKRQACSSHQVAEAGPGEDNELMYDELQVCRCTCDYVGVSRVVLPGI